MSWSLRYLLRMGNIVSDMCQDTRWWWLVAHLFLSLFVSNIVGGWGDDCPIVHPHSYTNWSWLCLILLTGSRWHVGTLDSVKQDTDLQTISGHYYWVTMHIQEIWLLANVPQVTTYLDGKWSFLFPLYFLSQSFYSPEWYLHCLSNLRRSSQYLNCSWLIIKPFFTVQDVPDPVWKESIDRR